MFKTTGFAATSPSSSLSAIEFERRNPLANDIQIDILYCGVCHSDLHTARNEWNGTTYPVIPGHEIVGCIEKVGSNVQNFKEGEIVAVGCLVDSCRDCLSCRENLEQFCEKKLTFTYNSPDPHTGKMTYGGYSKKIVVDEKFVLKISEKFPKEKLPNIAPLLCAGITTYSPFKHWNIGKNSRVGIVGLGGLGHMGIQFANALGAHVILFTTSANKIADGKRLGAHEVIISTQTEELKKYQNSFDFILDTVAAAQYLVKYTELLKRDGTLCLVGLPEKPHPELNAGSLIMKRRQISGSLIGGIKETQEMLDFCAEKKIVCEIEMIEMNQINQAYERMLKSDVKYRFVIDLATLKK